MTRIICAEDCGNSPRRLLIKKLLTALAKGDNGFVLKTLGEDVVWVRPGGEPIRGREAVAAFLEDRKAEPKLLMVISNIITHGPAGAANGTIDLGDGTHQAFSHVYRFRSAADSRIKEITEYLIET